MSISTDGVGVPEWDLSDRLGKALKESGVSVQQMAEHLEVHRNTVSNWMNGRSTPSRPMLITWALRTGVPFEWLRDGQVSWTRPPDDGGPVTDKPVGYLHLHRRPVAMDNLGETG